MRLWLCALALTAVTRVAAADDKVDCSFIEIGATNAKDPAIDPDLQPLEKKLKKPPFSSYNVFHQLTKGDIALNRLKAQALPFRKGGASVLLREKTDKRVELTVSMDNSDGKRALDVKQSINLGDWTLFVAQGKDDAHILALTCH